LSSSTIFGVWTGPAPYANDLPVMVKGRQTMERSALDSFSLLYTILVYDYGYHIPEIDREYVARIHSALVRGVISGIRNTSEFDAAMRIMRSFERTGHIFDAVNARRATDYATKLAGVPTEARWIQENAEMTFPSFEFTEDERQVCQQALRLNPHVRVNDIASLLMFLELAGMQSSYPYLWLSQRHFSTVQSQYAFERLQQQIQSLSATSGLFPAWREDKKNDMFKQLEGSISLQSLTTDLTAAIIERFM
jgi:hypothetical protein